MLLARLVSLGLAALLFVSLPAPLTAQVPPASDAPPPPPPPPPRRQLDPVADTRTSEPASEKEAALAAAGHDRYDTWTPAVAGTQIGLGLLAFVVSIPGGAFTGFVLLRDVGRQGDEFGAIVGATFLGPWLSSVGAVGLTDWIFDKDGSLLGAAGLGLIGIAPALGAYWFIEETNDEEVGVLLGFLAPMVTLVFTLNGYHRFTEAPEESEPSLSVVPTRDGVATQLRWVF